MGEKSISAKLLIKPNTTVWLSDTSRFELIEPLPEGVHAVDDPDQATTALIFADDAETLRGILAKQKEQLTSPGLFWVAYPKANRTNINRDTLWPILSEYAMRPISQVAIDEVWSALRFRALKEGEAPFTGEH
jgi:hypothetical protein